MATSPVTQMRSANIKVINASIKQLKKEEKTNSQEGMLRYLQAAMKTALALHTDPRRQMHKKVADSYGWMLVHDGKMVDMGINGGKMTSASSVTEKLKSLVVSLPQEGWIGVVMATMHPFRYYLLSEELSVMETTQNWTKVNFINFFKG